MSATIDQQVRAGASEAFAVACIKRLYGRRVAVQRLPGEYDDNFIAQDPDGGRFVFKLMHPLREQALVDLQVQALGHVHRAAPGLIVPEVMLTLAGRPFTPVEDEAGRTRLAWMLRYLEGTPWERTSPQDRTLRESLGDYVGRLDAALSSFAHPAAQRDLKWDSSRTGWIAPHIADIRDPARRATAGRCLKLFESVVLPALGSVRHSVIHADANECNTLTRTAPGEMPRVVAVIDYGDLHHGITLSGLAIAAAYAAFGTGNPLEAVADVLAGYHRVFPIPSNELPLLHPLVTSRLCVSVVNSAMRAKLLPDDPYATISEAPAWQVLEALMAITPDRALARFRLACGG